MKKDTKRKDKHLLQIEDLQMRLEEAEEESQISEKPFINKRIREEICNESA